MSHRDLTQIGKYQVEDLIGEGAMGVVYRAFDPVLNRHVAIKVMGDSLARDTELRDRFLREARAAGSLQHPNVITIYDFGEVDGHLYIAMEYIDGTDLEDLLRSGTPLSLDAKIGVMIDVLNGLGYAHRRGVVHRDIKPANIRVDEDGHARIMDFGIARLNSGAMTKMTRTGVMLGTPNYMAPEQIVGEAITPRTDIFAAGAVLYELLTNSRPFQAETLHAVLFKITSEPPPPLDSVLPGLPAALNSVVMKALEKEPERRYENAMEMANDLARVRASLGSAHATAPSLHATIERARLSGQSMRTRSGTKQRLLMAAGGVVGAAAMVALVLVALDSIHRESGETGAPGGVAPQGAVVSDSSASRANARGDAAADSASRSPLATAPQPSNAAARPDPIQSASSRGAAGTTTAPRPSGPSQVELGLIRQVREAARGARARAVAAGATASQLDSGDEQERRGSAALDRGDLSAAADYFSHASTDWQRAEREARSLASSSSALAVATRDAPTTQTRPISPGAPNISPTSSGSSSSSGAPPQVAVAPPVSPAPTPVVSTSSSPDPAKARADIAAVIAAYADAIEARDLAAMRRLYPAMTSDQQRSFQQFFASVRSMQARLAVATLQLDGTTAEAHITGSYAYVTSSGRSERQEANFRATLGVENGVWRMTAVR
jgi:serine/threonine protein kinase